MRRFCVKCGKETNKLVGSLCPACYLEKSPVIDLPEKIQVEVDKHNGKYRLGRLWLEPTDENLFRHIEEKIRSLAKHQLLPVESLNISFERREKSIDAAISFKTEVEGARIEVHKKMLLELIGSISDASMKLASNYHEAILQARFREKFTKGEAKEKLQEIMVLLHCQQKPMLNTTHSLRL